MKSAKLDDVKMYLDKLQSYKSKLPAALQTQVDSLQSTYDSAAKAKAALPNFNK